MKHRKIWQLLLTILLMGVMFAGCASAGTKTVNNIGSASVPQKAEDTSGAVKKEAAEKKDNGEKGTSMSDTNLKIKVVANGKEIVFALNDTSVSRSFYAQLPLTVAVENYSNNEKIFQPPQKLDCSRGLPCGVDCLFLALEQRVPVLRRCATLLRLICDGQSGKRNGTDSEHKGKSENRSSRAVTAYLLT